MSTWLQKIFCWLPQENQDDDDTRRPLLNKKMSFKFEEDRLKSFAGWDNKFVDKHILAKTGFYYLGTKDHVRCFFCRVRLMNWEKGDDEVREHLKWSPWCPIVRCQKTSNVPLKNTISLPDLLIQRNVDNEEGYDTVDCKSCVNIK